MLQTHSIAHDENVVSARAKTPATARRAFGDISNRGASGKTGGKPLVSKPKTVQTPTIFVSKPTRKVRFEEQPATLIPATKNSFLWNDDDSIERPAGRTFRQEQRLLEESGRLEDPYVDEFLAYVRQSEIDHKQALRDGPRLLMEDDASDQEALDAYMNQMFLEDSDDINGFDVPDWSFEVDMDDDSNLCNVTPIPL